MSAVNEWIVREYFESLGFLVSQPCKYVTTRQKKAEEEVDLVIFNPLVEQHIIPERVVWQTADFKTVARAVVGVRGWHTERFYAATFDQFPDILRFAQEESVRSAARRFGTGDVAKVLCLPQLPASEELKDKTLRVLKERGIDGVLSFRTMLTDLIQSIDVNRNYDKSDVLQIIRILKNYDLFRSPQMDLFAKKPARAPKGTGGRGRVKASVPPPPASGPAVPAPEVGPDAGTT